METVTETDRKVEELMTQFHAIAPNVGALYQDRGPLCFRVGLTPDDDGEFKPALYAMLEDGSDSYRILKEDEAKGRDRGWRWHVSLGGFEAEENILNGIGDSVKIEILERTWLGETEAEVATYLLQVALLMQNGAPKFV